nr:MAG TPA: hypothetical protein [Caudoviricetes sp.]
MILSFFFPYLFFFTFRRKRFKVFSGSMWMQRSAVFVISVWPELHRMNIQKFSDDLLSEENRTI